MIENPTWEQQKSLKNIIYLFRNKITNEIYIGQTSMFFYKRYSKKNWYNKLSNRYFRFSARKYGKENFILVFLKYSLETAEELDYWETFYIKEYDCIFPKGYNFTKGGKHFTEEHKRKIGERKFKTCSLKNLETGEIIKINNISGFCELHGLHESTIANVIHGRSLFHDKWTKPDTIIKSYEIMSPEGRVYKIYDGKVREFCRQYNLYCTCLGGVLSGKRSQHKGWTLPIEREYHTVFNSKGEMFKIVKTLGSITKFCNDNNLDYESFCYLLRKKTKISQGWTLDGRKQKYYKVISPTNEEFEITPYTIKEFCDTNSLKYAGFRNLFDKKAKTYKKWRLLEIIYK